MPSHVVSPYYTNTNSIDITGLCYYGSFVVLSGDGAGSKACSGSTFSFTVLANADGFYNYLLNEVDAGNNVSAPVSMIWIRKSNVSAPVMLTPVGNPYESAAETLTIQG